jgi:hypothetical protein
MGHQHLGVLPRSKDWQRVIQEIRAGADVATISAATSEAAERSMIDASNDEGVRHAFFLLTQLPLAARSEDFPRALANLGLNVKSNASLVEIVTALTASIDRHVALSKAGTDYGEMAQLSAIEALYSVVSRELPGLLEPEPREVTAAIARFATVKQFAILAREFFSRLTQRHLEYYLTRELSSHVGTGQTFATLRQHNAFNKALELHCRETSRIIQEFSGEWFSKQNYEGGIDPGKAGRFVHVAARKIRDELRQRRGLAANA